MAYISSPTNIDRIGGRKAGDGLGNDIRTTRKVPVLSTKYSQGLPLHAIDQFFLNGGYWEIPVIEGKKNGVSEIGTSADPNGFAFITAMGLNRYQAGQPGYLEETLAFLGIDEATGGFECLVGVFLRGLLEDGEFDKIINAVCWGYVWNVPQVAPIRVFRIYKGGEIIHETVSDDWVGEVPFDDLKKQFLHIFQLDYAYLGIYPPVLRITDDMRQVKELHTEIFEQDVTYIDDPNITVGVYLKNNGNTSNIRVRNGSLQLGNYAERLSPDPSARPLIDEVAITPSIGTGTNNFIVAYKVPNKVNMYSKIDSNMTPTIAEFRNTISNQLLGATAFGEHQSANKRATLNFYFIDEADVTGGSFLPVRANVNVLQKSLTKPTYDLADATKFETVSVPNGIPNTVDLIAKQVELIPGKIAIIEMSNTSIIDAFSLILDTSDLF